MSTASKSFTAVGDGPDLLVRQGESFTYDVSGTFVGTVVLQQFVKGGWTPVVSAADVASGTVTAEPGNGGTHERYHLRCTAFTSGTIVTVLTPVTSQVLRDRRTPDGTLLEEVTEAGLKSYSPILSSPSVSTARGALQTIEATFTETGAGVYTAAVAVPAGATIHDIVVNGVALWNAATSAALIVGDAADDNGYFDAVNLKATDLLAGESISFAQAGGKAGAYIANSQVSPRYAPTARVISGIVTSVGAGTLGRTRMTVVYSLPVSTDIVAATKV